MIAFLTVIHVIISILLVVSILLQSSKGGGLAGMFGGGGGMGQMLGGRGAASFLSKVSLWLAVGFAFTSISIALLSAGTSARRQSLLEQVSEQEAKSTPAAILPAVPGTDDSSPSEPGEAPEPPMQ